MSGFNIGKGLKEGLNYYRQFERELAWAVKTGNTEAISALVHIGETNAHELGGVAIELSDAQVFGIIFNPDITKGSRQLMHDFEAKYGKH